MLRLLYRPLLAVVVLATAQPAFAVCVVRGPLCATWKDYDEIFDGTVMSIRRVDEEEDWGGKRRMIGHRLVTLRVHDRWRGSSSERVELLLSGGYGVVYGESFNVEEGKRYVIFARHRSGRLTTSGCDPSIEYSQAGSGPRVPRNAAEAANRWPHSGHRRPF